MKKAAFVEVVGGTLVAAANVAYITVFQSYSAPHGFSVIITTYAGVRHCYGTRDDEDAANQLKLELAESIGAVIADK